MNKSVYSQCCSYLSLNRKASGQMKIAHGYDLTSCGSGIQAGSGETPLRVPCEGCTQAAGSCRGKRAPNTQSIWQHLSASGLLHREPQLLAGHRCLHSLHTRLSIQCLPWG